MRFSILFRFNLQLWLFHQRRKVVKVDVSQTWCLRNFDTPWRLIVVITSTVTWCHEAHLGWCHQVRMTHGYLTSHGCICHRAGRSCETYLFVVSIRKRSFILAVMGLCHLFQLSNISGVRIVSHYIPRIMGHFMRCGDLIDGHHDTHRLIIIW